MLFITHITFSLLIGILFLKYFSSFVFQDNIIFIFCVILGSIIPDIDNPNSKIGKKLPLISYIIKFTIGHRSIFHSIWMMSFIPILLLISGFKITAYGIFIGYFSHLILDSMTISGIKPFYPLNFTIRGIIRTGSFFEKTFLILIFITTLILILQNIS